MSAALGMAVGVLAGVLAPVAVFLGAWAGLALRARHLDQDPAGGAGARLPAAFALGAGLAAGTLLGGLAASGTAQRWDLLPTLGAFGLALATGGAILSRPRSARAAPSSAPSLLLAGGGLGAALLLLAGTPGALAGFGDPRWPPIAALLGLASVHAARRLAEQPRRLKGAPLGRRQIAAAGLFGAGLAAAQAVLARAWLGSPRPLETPGVLGAEAIVLLALAAITGLVVLLQLGWRGDAAAAAGARRGLDELRATLAKLEGEMRNHRLARDALVEANQSLRARMDAEQRLLADSRALGELGQRLQACRTEADIARLLAAQAGRVLPGSSGMLLRRAADRHEYVTAAQWGTPRGLGRFAGDQCLAQQGGLARHSVGGTGERCAHLAAVQPGHAVSCMPLQANGEEIGLLCLELPAQREFAYLEQFAVGIADRVALALGGARLRAQAIRDPLTGLHNRRVLEEALGREIARAGRDGKQLALLLFDIDEFKAYNDCFGHDAGDHAIRAVADSLRVRLRSSDVLCRYGGEEFLALLTDTRLHEAVNRAREVCEHVRGLLATDPQLKRRITLSAGVAAFPDHGGDGADLVRAADAALYLAKASGRDRVVLAAG
jgi:diguanylate cyclase (GGDEF)-like protein